MESGGAVGAVVLVSKSVFIENSEFVRLSGSGLLDCGVHDYRIVIKN